MANPPPFETNHLKAVPEFDGETHALSRYINSCELLISQFYNNVNINCYQNKLLLSCLTEKLKGNARLVVETQPCETWVQLKDILVRNFSDVRNEENLIIDLTNMRQKSNETPQLFYERCLAQLATMNNRATLHEVPAVRQVKITQYTSLTLSIFLNGLLEPLRTNILNMRPASMVDAIQFIRERENNNAIFNRYRNMPNNNNNNKNVVKKPQQQNNNSNFIPYNNNYHNNQNQARNSNNNNQQQQNYVPSQKSNNTNVFAPKPLVNPSKPTPMSISTRNTNQQNNRQMWTAEQQNETEENTNENYEPIDQSDYEQILQLPSDFPDPTEPENTT